MPPEYVEEESSSDESIANGPPLSRPALLTRNIAVDVPKPQMKRTGAQTGKKQFDKAYNDQFHKDKGLAQKTATPVTRQSSTSLATASHSPDIEDGYNLVTSDVLRKSVNKGTPSATTSPELRSARGGPKSKSPGTMAKQPMNDARRKLISERLKKRWASGSMDHVPQLARQTALKRKSLGDSNGSVDDQARKKAKSGPSEPLPPLATPQQSSKPSIKSEVKPSKHTELWNYVQPLLDTYRGVEQPITNGTQRLLTLPRVRDVEWNPSAYHPFSDKQRQSVSALMLYLVGDMQEQPCTRCADGYGTFKGCVRLTRDVAGTSSCANCFYSHQSCGSGQSVGPRKQKQEHISVRQEQPDGYVTEFEDERQDEEDEQQDLMHFAVAKNNAKTVANLKPISTTPKGRPYDQWEDGDGLFFHKNGLLLPDGYNPTSIVDPSRPWVCPVTDCTESYSKRKSLHFHFPRKHYGRMFNDNCNGTLTEVFVYDNTKLLTGGKYPSNPPSLPIIVSQKPCNPGLDLGQQLLVSSAATPQRQRQSQRILPTDGVAIAKDDSSDSEARPMSEAAILSAMTPEDAKRARANWDYIRPHLASTKSIPTNGHVKELLPLPRLRTLQWNPTWDQGFVEKVARDISCMVIQLTGEEAEERCTECAKGKGPFDGCVVIARDADPKVRSHMVSCANCNYHGRQNKCSITKWVQEREQSYFPPYVNQNAKRKAARTSTAALELVEPGEDAEVVVEVSRSRRARASEPANIPAALPADPPRVQDQMLLVQEWERAPGRIRSEVATEPDNLAMSAVFLGTSNYVQISHDTYLRVIDILPASVYRFEVDHDSNRHCSIGSGTLKVHVEGEPEFTIGSRGVFKIRAGAKCTVDNLTYGCAAITVIRQFED